METKLNPDALGDLYEALRLVAPYEGRLQHRPNMSISAATYKAVCAALARARGEQP